MINTPIPTATVQTLIKKTQDLLKERYEYGNHHTVVAAGILSENGNMYAALHLGTNQPSLATCAEIITIGQGVLAEIDFRIRLIVAVRDKDCYIISPCGKCREYIADYGPNAMVAVPSDCEMGYEIVSIHDLLPHKYCKK